MGRGRATRVPRPSARRTTRPSTDRSLLLDSGSPRRGQLYRLAWAFYLVLALAGVVWLGWRRGVIPVGLFVEPENWVADLGLGLAGGGLLVGLWRLVRLFVPSARRLEELLTEVLGPLEREEVVALALVSGFAEELFFRGAVQGAWGWPVATVLFTVLHVGPGATYRIWTAFAAVAGLLLAGLVEWRGALLPAVVAHVLVNAVGLTRLRSRGAR